MEIELGCPVCDADVSYEELESQGDDGSKCPSCGVTSPNDQWFEEE